MTISDERNNGMESIRNQFFRVRERVYREVGRRQSRGFTRAQVLTGLAREISEGNFNVLCSPPPPGSSIPRRPSEIVINQILFCLDAARNNVGMVAAAPIAPGLIFSSRALNLGNAVRNLESELSATRPSSQRIATAGNSASLRALLSNGTQNLRRLDRRRKRNSNRRERTPGVRRNANERERSPLFRRNDNERERSPLSRRNANEWERTPPPRRNANERERTPPLRRNANEWERTPHPRRDANERERTPPPRRIANEPETPPSLALPPRHDPSIPAYQYNPDTFNPSNLTLEQALTVMCYFDVKNDNEFELMRNSLLDFSIKIYGLENWSGKEFRRSMFRFFGKYFGMKPEIVICARPVRDHREKGVVGVLFKRCETALRIMARRNVLCNTRYRISRNDRLDWIIFKYEL